MSADDFLARRSAADVLWLFDQVVDVEEDVTFGAAVDQLVGQGLNRKTAVNVIGEMQRFGLIYKARQRYKPKAEDDVVRATVLGRRWRVFLDGEDVPWPDPWGYAEADDADDDDVEEEELDAAESERRAAGARQAALIQALLRSSKPGPLRDRQPAARAAIDLLKKRGISPERIEGIIFNLNAGELDRPDAVLERFPETAGSTGR